MESSAFKQKVGVTFPVCWHLHIPVESVTVTHSVQVLWQSFNHRVRVSVSINRKSRKAVGWGRGVGEEVTLYIGLQSRPPAACACAGHLSPGKAAGSLAPAQSSGNFVLPRTACTVLEQVLIISPKPNFASLNSFSSRHLAIGVQFPWVSCIILCSTFKATFIILFIYVYSASLPRFSWSQHCSVLPFLRATSLGWHCSWSFCAG